MRSVQNLLHCLATSLFPSSKQRCRVRLASSCRDHSSSRMYKNQPWLVRWSTLTLICSIMVSPIRCVRVVSIAVPWIPNQSAHPRLKLFLDKVRQRNPLVGNEPVRSSSFANWLLPFFQAIVLRYLPRTTITRTRIVLIFAESLSVDKLTFVAPVNLSSSQAISSSSPELFFLQLQSLWILILPEVDVLVSTTWLTHANGNSRDLNIHLF